MEPFSPHTQGLIIERRRIKYFSCPAGRRKCSTTRQRQQRVCRTLCAREGGSTSHYLIEPHLHPELRDGETEAQGICRVSERTKQPDSSALGFNHYRDCLLVKEAKMGVSYYHPCIAFLRGQSLRVSLKHPPPPSPGHSSSLLPHHWDHTQESVKSVCLPIRESPTKAGTSPPQIHSKLPTQRLELPRGYTNLLSL